MVQVAHIGTYALPRCSGRAAHIAGYGQKEVSVLEELLDLVDRSAQPDSEY
jgi:hypothetical protein